MPDDTIFRDASLCVVGWDPLWGVVPSAEIRARKEAVRRVLPWVTMAHGNIRELNT
jgi:hypothetical protein